MAAHEPSWSERIRDLIDEVDRIRNESERMRGRADDAMKQKQFWPERRQQSRIPSDDKPRDAHRGA